MKIAVFYHIAQIGFAASMYQSQVHRLYSSGLIKELQYLHFGVNGDKELFNVPKKAIVNRNKNYKEETDTLISLKEFCKENPEYKVLYFHTKGISQYCLNGESWRLMMEYFVIDKWKECVKYLDDYDAVGSYIKVLGPTTWSDGSMTWEKSGTKHFVGNFWWSNARYVNKLDDKFLTSNFRLDREFWIGSGNGNMKSLYQPNNCEPYEHFYAEEEYVS